MIELNVLSKIGYGSYNVTSVNKEHYKSLKLAISLGCNLIDTAPNYTNGESEKLIGEVLMDLKREDLFIISKAGYIQGNDLSNIKNFDFKNIARIKDNFWYSLNIDFLEYQINNTLRRLGSKTIDGFLLHNPEHYFSDLGLAIDKKEIYKIIENAFSFLEDKVRKGVIRYYGISSNVLPLSSENHTTLSLSKLVHIARTISEDNHFKIIQFPFNYVENQAFNETHENNLTLLNICKNLNLITFGNRPLNIHSPDGFLRLATYEQDFSELDDNSSNLLFENVFELILTKLKEHDMQDQWEEFPILPHLKANWKNFGNPESVNVVFQEHFYPFLDSIFEGHIPEHVRLLISNFFITVISYSKKRMTERAKNYENILIKKGIIAENDKPLSSKICNHYLAQGIDHVLIGMRSERYVKDIMKNL